MEVVLLAPRGHPGPAQGLHRATSTSSGRPGATAPHLALLIVVAEQPALEFLIERAESIGLTPLVEVHDEDESMRGGRRSEGHRRQRA
ncbi:hypothetical protein SGRIM119S_08467 [Streptomyces griseorubiginosus]